MLPTMRLSPVSLLVAAAGTISTVVCHDCAFVPGPITASDDQLVSTVNCSSHRHDEVALGNTTGDHIGLVVYLYNCITVPVGLFVNVSSNLSTVSVVSEDSEQLLEGTFEGLGKIAELRLEGFQSLSTLSSAVFRPLRNLERLLLVEFGADLLTYVELGEALYRLSGTPLRRIVMHRIHSLRNEKALHLPTLFRMRNVTVRELTFSDNVLTAMSGRMSRVLPNLTYVCVGCNARYYAAMNAVLDTWMFLRDVHEVVYYAYPVPDTVNRAPLPAAILLHRLDPAILNYLLPYLFQPGCYSGFNMPMTPSLRRLTVRNLQMLDAVIDKPICYDTSNNIDYLDWAGSPLPTNTTLNHGLDQLRFLNISNTGIAALPREFLRYYPKLEGLNLGQLSIGEWMKHINSSFFGQCPTLREIHLGDCQLMMIPSDAFSLLPSLQTLNLSSNSLQSFDVNFSDNGNLTHLNLSSNRISTMSEDVLAQLNTVARRRLEEGGILTVDLRHNPSLSCLCNSIHFVRQLRDWTVKREVNLPGWEEFRCLYPNASIVAMSRVDVDQSEEQCGVISEIKNGSDCPCDDDLRQRLELVRLSLHGYVCRNSDGKLTPMTVRPLPGCPDFFRNVTFIAPVVAGCVLALSLVGVSIILYRYRKSDRLHRIIERLGMDRIVRIGIQHVMLRNRGERNNFEHDVFLYIQDNDQGVVRHWFDAELTPRRNLIRHDDFRVGLKLETLLEDVQSCRWLVPVLSQNFVDDGECCDFIARAQYTRPHAIVPVVWTPFHTDDLTINSLVDTAEPVKWPGDAASDAEKATFWRTLLERTGSHQ